jgi:hypothetical protein
VTMDLNLRVQVSEISRKNGTLFIQPQVHDIPNPTGKQNVLCKP